MGDRFITNRATGGGEASSPFLSGTVSVYADLPTPAVDYNGQFWLVTNPSGGFWGFLNVHKYGQGIYTPNPAGEWQITPFKVQVTEDAMTVLNIQSGDWGNYFTISKNIYIGDRVIYDDVIYRNKTGTQTSTSPDLDTTNWGRPEIDYIQFDTAYAPNGHIEGTVHWNQEFGTFEVDLPGGQVSLLVGQEHVKKVKATENILNGQAVYIDGADGANPTVSLADNGSLLESYVLGIATEDIALNDFGYVTLIGDVNDIDTSAWTEGDILWLGTSGNLTNVRPEPPAMNVFIGVVLRSNVNNGRIGVKPTVIPRLRGLSDVYSPTTPNNGEQLHWNTANARWEVGNYEHTIHVAKSGGNYTTIEAALASITDNSSTNRYLILVHSGIYNENNPLLLKNYVTIKSAGTNLNTRIVANTTTLNLFETENVAGGFMFIEDVSLSGVDSTHYAIYNPNACQVVARNVTLYECGNGIYSSNAAGVLDTKNISIYNPTATTVKGFEVTGGKFYINQFQVVNNSTITTIFDLTGTTVDATLTDLKSFSTNVGTGLNAGDGAHVRIKVAQAENFNDGIVISGNNTNLDAASINFDNIGQDAVRVDNTGTNIRLGFWGGEIRNVGRYAFNILNASSTIVGSGLTELSKINAVAGAQIYATIIDLTTDDEGVNIFGELHVGTPLNPVESVFGEGDSYTRGMLVYTYDGTSYVNVSADAASASGSTFTYPNNLANSAIYVASAVPVGADYTKHLGLKLTATTALVKGTGNIIPEYWNGTAWTEFNTMSTQSSGSFYPYANQLFQQTGGIQLRYDIALYTGDWTKNDPVSLGLPLFWVRYRITAPVTTLPIFEQFKLHSNRSEINSDGFLEYFGKGRPVGTLRWDVGLFEGANVSPSDQDVYLSDYLGVGRIENNFLSNAIDRVGMLSPIPNDCDTSCKVIFQWSCLSSDTGGNIEWWVTWGYSSQGANVYTNTASAPATAPTEQWVNLILPAPTAIDTEEWYRAEVDISDLVSKREGGFPDTLWLTLERSGNSVADTHNGNVTVIAVDAKYIKWNNGGHLDL